MKVAVAMKYGMIAPKTGETNRMFGLRYLRRHKVRDRRWTAADKISQYEALARLYDHDRHLSQINEAADEQRDKKLIKRLRQEVKEKKVKLNVALHGDKQRVRNMMIHDKQMKRHFPELSTWDLVEGLEHLTFTRRKQLDKLKFHRDKLLATYEARLLEVSALQDRIKYRDSVPFKEAADIQKYEYELKNSETRIRALVAMKISFKKLISVLSEDSIFFDPVLDALKEEMEEQEDFIQRTILIGKPVLKSAKVLEKEYHKVERSVKAETSRRIKFLLEQREKINSLKGQAIKLVRRDSDFEIDFVRYKRDSPAITELKEQISEMIPVFRKLKEAVMVCKTTEIFPKIQEEYEKDDRMLTRIRHGEAEKNSLQLRLQHAKAIEESLKLDLTDDEIEQLTEIEELEAAIKKEEKTQKDLEEKIKFEEQNVVLIRMAFQHINEVLSDIGKPLPPSSKMPESSLLRLPLFDFEATLSGGRPTPPFEDNIDILIASAKAKIEILVKEFESEVEREKSEEEKTWEAKFKSAQTQEEQELLEKLQKKVQKEEKILKWKVYHNAIRRELTSGYIGAAHKDDERPLIEEAAAEDPSVPTRTQIKEASSKMVAKMSKRDD